MGILFNFLSSFLLGAGAGLVLTIVMAVIAKQLFGLHLIKNFVLSVLLFIFATFQTVLLYSAYTAKDYVDIAYSLINTTTENVDVEALNELLPNLVNFIPEEYLPKEAADATEAAASFLLDTTDVVSNTSDTVVRTSLALIDAINDTLNAYILRRWLWLIGEIALFLILAGLMRKRSPKYASDMDLFSDAGGSTTSTMNF